MTNIPSEALASIRDRQTLFGFLNKHLNWPVDPQDTFTYKVQQPTSSARPDVEVSRIVPFGADDPFLIMLCEFETGFRRTDLRDILGGIKKDMRKRGAYQGKSLEDIIFICAANNYASLSFAHFQQQENRLPKLSTFGWETADVTQIRTLREFNLPPLFMRLDADHQPAWDQIRGDWLKAWDVERVSDDFYKSYEEIFKTVEDQHIGPIKGDDKRLFALRLFNRLLFLQFVQKKKWLRINGSVNYLQELYKQAIDNGENFYRDRLYWLFFHGLGTPANVVSPVYSDRQAVVDRIGEVPFLNGGLFQCEDVDDHYDAVQIDNDAFGLMINNLFCRYNFTITESSPLDVDVAVDPEMLGSIFERLVTDRHDSGSYYTPKPIVSFMCREALKGYLSEQLDAVSEDAVARFVDEHDPSGIVNSERALQVLKSVRVCDPACGSGAYLLGMLHELLGLRQCLFAVKQNDAATVYERKLDIIQNNLYGVDLDPFAVNIARLRLWLSLVVDDDRNPIDDPGARDAVALPNLDFKIEVGNSVICPDPQISLENTGFRRLSIEEYVKAKAEYLRAHNEKKHELYKKIIDLRNDIFLMEARQADNIRFDWSVDFAEIFNPEDNKPGGFDIVVANPPYVRQELVKDVKPALKGIYNDLFCGTADLYVYFYLRAIQMLKEGGMLTFISSNKWFKAAYGANLRKHVADNCSVISITDFGDQPVFQKATAYPMIFIARKGGSQCEAVLTNVKSLADPYPNVKAIIDLQGVPLPESAFAGANWTLTDSTTADILRKMEKAGTPLGEYVGHKIYRGILTGFNTAFVINGDKRRELIAADPKSSEIIKPLVAGKDVRRWSIVDRGRWLIFTRHGIDIDAYPAIKEHLASYREQLDPRPFDWPSNKKWNGRKSGSYKWYEIQDNIAYYREFEKPKIIYPEVAESTRFAVDNSGFFALKTCYIIPVYDLYLLGILNSSSFLTYQQERQNTVRGGYLMNSTIYLEVTPIPDASDSDKALISGLVQKCLDAQGAGCEEWEREIDERVAALYGL